MSIDKVKYIKVFPGMGTGRVGNSEEYFIGPEAPGVVPDPGGMKYKDSNGLIKRQAARFRVYGYDENDAVVMEITEDPSNGVSIEWDVHVRNMKAANYAFQGKFAFKPTDLRNPGYTKETNPNNRTPLIIDPGAKKISGINKNGTSAVPLDGGKIFDFPPGETSYDIPNSLYTPGKPGTQSVAYKSKEVSLGRLETDDSGRLIFVGGKGDAGCLLEKPIPIRKGVSEFNNDKNMPNHNPTSNGNSYFNNPGWFDDTCGGSINATVTFNSLGTPVTLSTDNDPLKRGWVAVSPPKYVPSMNNVVSLLDLQIDLFPDQDPYSGSLNFAIIDENGIPNIATGDPADGLSFAPLNGITQQGQLAPSITSFKGKDYLAYTGDSGANLLAVSADGGASWTSVTIANGVSTAFAPSLCTFNGQLVYVVTAKNGYINIGTSDNGSDFTFRLASPAGGVEALRSLYGPSAAAYNGFLYIGFTGTGGVLSIAQQGVDNKDKETQDLFTFTSLETHTKSHDAPSLCTFFGQLYYGYTGVDDKCYLGSYNSFSPQPTPPTLKFDFAQIGGDQTTTLAPSIGASHGRFYYTIVGPDNYVHVASGKSGFTSLTFGKAGNVASTAAPAVANFSDISFYRDIYPILKTVTDYAWVNEPAFTGHAPGSMGDFLREGSIDYYANPLQVSNVYRVFVFQAIRQAEQLTPMVPPPPFALPPDSVPNGGIQSGRLMPHLFGEGGSTAENQFNGTNHPNQWLSLTPHQLWKIQEWVNGNFQKGTIVKPKPLESYPLEDQPRAINFAALEPTVGGGFHPGIELTYNLKFREYFAGAFRFADKIIYKKPKVKSGNNPSDPIEFDILEHDLTPGSVAGYMSIPWQGDFWSCNISWWAAMRPDLVVDFDQSQEPPRPVPIPWFRGEAVGIPPNADSIPGYQGGYEHMARYWSYFGFVVPNGNKYYGEFVLAETERAACLDDKNAPCVSVNPEAPAGPQE